jgi:hypothetical protein
VFEVTNGLDSADSQDKAAVHDLTPQRLEHLVEKARAAVEQLAAFCSQVVVNLGRREDTGIPQRPDFKPLAEKTSKAHTAIGELAASYWQARLDFAVNLGRGEDTGIEERRGSMKRKRKFGTSGEEAGVGPSESNQEGSMGGKPKMSTSNAQVSLN